MSWVKLLQDLLGHPNLPAMRKTNNFTAIIMIPNEINFKQKTEK